MTFPAPLCYPHFGRATIALNGDGTYRDGLGDPDGQPAHLVEVLDHDGYVAGEVAWLAEDPRRWYLAPDTPPILGLPEVSRSYAADAALLLLEMPFEFIGMMGQRCGAWPAACILDWTADLELWLGGVPEIATRSPRVAKALGRHLAREPLARFKIRIVAQEAEPESPPRPTLEQMIAEDYTDIISTETISTDKLKATA
jgi:hypothetical protein